MNAKHISLAAFLLWPLNVRAQTSDTLVGHVRDSRGVAITGATAIVTTLPARHTVTALTDAAGTFRVSFDRENATALLLVVRADGFAELRRSIPIDSTHVPLSIVLQRATAATLDAVQVRANRIRPPRSMGLDGDMGPEALRVPITGGVRGLLSPLDEGSLDRLVSLIPGMFNDGLGAFGLGADQTLVTLNGVAADAGTVLPLGLATTIQVNNAGTNGALGGAAGSNINISIAPGSAFHYSSFIANYEGAPPISSARGLGYNGSRASLGVSGNGPIGDSRWRYNGAISGTAAAIGAGTSAFSGADGDVLRTLGIAEDSVTRVSSVLQPFGLALRGHDSQPMQQSLSGLVRLDRLASGNRNDLRVRQWSLTLQGNTSRTDANVSPFASATTGLHGIDQRVQAIAKISEYIGFQQSWLHESRISGSLSSSHRSPELDGIAGRVRLLSDVDGEILERTIAFGGAGSDGGKNSAGRLDYQTRLARVWVDGRMQGLTIDLFASAEQSLATRSTNSLGIVSYQSIDDLSAGTPFRFARDLTGNRLEMASGSGGVAFTGIMWPKPRWQLTAIARTEAEVVGSISERTGETSTTAPAQHRSPSVTRSQFAISPRFTLRYFDNARPHPTNPNRSVGSFNTLHQGPTWQHGDYSRSWTLAIARFNGALQNSLRAAGNNAVSLSIDCTGANVPLRTATEWLSGENIPAACADGSQGSAAVPGSRSVANAYSPPSTWEASIARERAVPLIGGSMRVRGMHRTTSNVQTMRDNNLSTAIRATDADGRALLVDPTSIDAGSGSIPLAASRVDATRGRDIVIASDGVLRLSQLSVDYVPAWQVMNRLSSSLQLGYAWQSSSRLGDGIGVLASAEPGNLQRVPSAVPVHQLSLRVARNFGAVAVSGNVFVSSGYRFTPIVDQDVNGDGWANDRANVPADANTAQSIRDLRTRVPNGVRGCLDDVLQSGARINRCSAPWFVNSALSVFYIRPLPLGYRAVHFSANLSNPVAVLDQLLHGSSNLRGWGSVAVPDPRLLSVQSFDAQHTRFVYAVNPRFGQTAPARSGVWSPFRLTLTATVDLAAPVPVQQLNEFLSVRRNGTRVAAPVATVEQRIRDEYQIGSPYFGVLARLDSLRLDERQYRLVRDGDEQFRARTDSLVSSFAKALTDSPRRGSALVNLRDAQRIEYSTLYTRELVVIGNMLRTEQLLHLNPSLQRAIREAQAGESELEAR